MPSRVFANHSPYFRLFHQHLDIQHLRIFGVVVYPCLSSQSFSARDSISSPNGVSPHLVNYTHSSMLLVFTDKQLEVLIPHMASTGSTTHYEVNAMKEEVTALTMQGTWILVPPPTGVNIVGNKWIYKMKHNSDGSVSRYKARLVVQGFSHKHRFDYTETSSPVVSHTTVRIILSLATMHGWFLRQLDVKNAFLHGNLEEEVFLKQCCDVLDNLQNRDYFKHALYSQVHEPLVIKLM
ncbi:hypothetical protein L3X38_019941 [Prunus dulcis]|uniref:Reverse transcriptase Ty1/copia-type domain-containing protein n=1 Tax=Prunus dulcis TaxID=3755 RepID=A0AAD4WEL4_PRUDU|nr:hypothetical protein L3X38_019941 [Prunus dulcis]